MKISGSLLCLGVLLLPAGAAFAQTASKPSVPVPLTVTVRPWGPDQAALDATKATVSRHPAVTRYLEGTQNRLLYLDLLDSAKPYDPPDKFRIVFYDYTNNLAVTATGLLADPSSLTVTTSRQQPQPSREEYELAVSMLQKDDYFGPFLASGALAAYQPMPPVIESSATGVQNDRIVTVGLYAPKGSAMNEIAGANLSRGTVVRFPNGAPPTAIANAAACGPPSAGQTTTPRGTAGQYQLTVTQASTTLWTMLIIRPSVSSGTRASGIELRDVEYLGKRVLKRGHVPVLNVQYVGNACGPYRDWQYQEGMFATNGTDVAPGIRACTTPPQTILDNGTDTGNFRGVAYHVGATEVVLKTELEAGWYRYVHEWRFDVNGTIRPRFAFGATSSSCVCNTHTHHAYFRLDFDIGNSEKNVVWELNGRWLQTRRTTEMMSLRSPTSSRRWIIENAGTGDKYMIVPRAIDGTADVYGRGDLWFLRYHPDAELDDGYNQTGGSGTEINLDPFLNGESIDKQDVVIWYGTHNVHIGGELDEDFVGPDLIPVQW